MVSGLPDWRVFCFFSPFSASFFLMFFWRCFFMICGWYLLNFWTYNKGGYPPPGLPKSRKVTRITGGLHFALFMIFYNFLDLFYEMYKNHTNHWADGTSRFSRYSRFRDFFRSFHDLFQRSIFGCTLVAIWLPLAPFWLPCGTLWQLLAYFWCPLVFLLVALKTFCRHSVPFCSLWWFVLLFCFLLIAVPLFLHPFILFCFARPTAFNFRYLFRFCFKPAVCKLSLAPSPSEGPERKLP